FSCLVLCLSERSSIRRLTELFAVPGVPEPLRTAAVGISLFADVVTGLLVSDENADFSFVCWFAHMSSKTYSQGRGHGACWGSPNPRTSLAQKVARLQHNLLKLNDGSKWESNPTVTPLDAVRRF